jgi:hypothetical protein
VNALIQMMPDGLLPPKMAGAAKLAGALDALNRVYTTLDDDGRDVMAASIRTMIVSAVELINPDAARIINVAYNSDGVNPQGVVADIAAALKEHPPQATRPEPTLGTVWEDIESIGGLPVTVDGVVRVINPPPKA